MNDDEFLDSIEQERASTAKEPPSCEVVRLRVSEFHTQRGYAVRIELNRVEKYCTGYQMLKDDFGNTGELLGRITNLTDAKPGLYEVIMVNASRDWETGIVDDWDLELVPFTPPAPGSVPQGPTEPAATEEKQ